MTTTPVNPSIMSKISGAAKSKLQAVKQALTPATTQATAATAPVAGKAGLGRLMTIGKFGVAALAGQLALEQGPGLVKGFREQYGPMWGDDPQAKQLGQVLEAQQAIERFGRIQKRRQRDLETMVNVNTEMLARNAPHLFNQIMAGRELPQDATVIGGEPRSDLMREVATQMSQGAFSQGEANGPSFP